MFRKLAIVLGIVVAVIFITAGVVYYLVTRPSNVENRAASLVISSEVTQRSQNKIEEFKTQLASASEDQLLSLTLTDEEVTALIIKELNTNNQILPLSLQNPRVIFVGDKIMLLGDVKLSGIKSNISIETAVQAYDNQLELTINQLNIGKLPLPDIILNKIKENITPDKEILIDMSKIGIPMDLKNASVENSQITLVGLAR